VRLLLDTHILLWWLDDNARLGRKARNLIADPNSDVLVSQVSLWETAIKHRIGKLHVGPEDILPRLSEFGFTLLTISNAHLMAIARLENHHSDPFDHLLLAQALVEKAAVVTADRKLPLYGIPCVPA
jgi:PIN domain nuclease of toxin-antitoxin system